VNACTAPLSLSPLGVSNPDLAKAPAAWIQRTCLGIAEEPHMQFPQRGFEPERDDASGEHVRLHERQWRQQLGHAVVYYIVGDILKTQASLDALRPRRYRVGITRACCCPFRRCPPRPWCFSPVAHRHAVL